jgi:hypothetical protein
LALSIASAFLAVERACVRSAATRKFVVEFCRLFFARVNVMTAYLVGAKTAVTPSGGAMMVYLIEAKTKLDALAAVKRSVPLSWTVEDVLGTADAQLVGLHRPRLHMPEQL